MRALAIAVLLVGCEQGERPEPVMEAAAPEIAPAPAPVAAPVPQPPRETRCCRCIMEDNRLRQEQAAKAAKRERAKRKKRYDTTP
jgi:hypothetical protein